MKITEEHPRDNNNMTFYSLEVGDVFIIVDSSYYYEDFPEEKFFYKTNGTVNSGNAVCLDDGRMKCFNGGLSCYKIDAELIIHGEPR